MTSIDDYIEQEKEKAKGSITMNAACAPTLKNCNHINVVSTGKGGIAVLKVPEKFVVVVHSAGGDPNIRNMGAYAGSLVDRLVGQARAIGATPVAFADVIDASTPERLKIGEIAEALVGKAGEYGLAIMNGETAMLGKRVVVPANLSGTMISLIGRDSPVLNEGIPRTFLRNGVYYAAFDPGGKPVFINSDGVGTKTEFYERSGKYELAFRDFMAMTLDDASKLAAIAKVISGVIETRGSIPTQVIRKNAVEFARQIGLLGIVQEEDVGNRILGYATEEASYNLSGSVVSVIDEERLLNPPAPRAGDHLVAIRGKPNPRSNGITGKREAMVAKFGNYWHKMSEGRKFLDFLAEPSTVFYPVFEELLRRRAASSVYHMSGGAYNDKLAVPFAKHSLFVEIKDLFKPDWRELELAIGTPNEDAYKTWPMGNEGFITTADYSLALMIIEKHGLSGRYVGQLGVDESGRKGIKLAGIKSSKGEDICYPEAT